MADPLPKYRFLPWTRRGLAAAVPQADPGGALPARAPLPVGIAVSGVAPANVNLELYGPGDVIGIDQRLIVRTEPRANLTDFESNYLAAIEFDLPDFPWMFTPARAGAKEQLRPWCVLVVFDLRVVASPIVHRGAPLPVITVPADVSAKELPNLVESWAWAHAQVMSDNTQVTALQQEMVDRPNLNVSRLICPRRLEPNQRYIACLVPAFDLGVQRGLGQTPNGTTVKPAWEGANPGEVKLPLYFHWQFATGPAGDFESLARRLTPVKAPGEMGFQRMFVGAPGGGLPARPEDDEASYLNMEGALRAPKANNSSLDNVTPAMRAGLRDAINAAAEVANGTSTTSIALSPPVYGEWHLNRHTVRDAAGQPEWLRELNLDPRARAAAGLGAEVVRANQEDFMQAAWEQVGDVIKANELLNRARFSTDVHRRTYERHFVPQPQDRLFQLAAPVHTRTPIADKTVRARVTAASLPNSSIDPALRRLVSPQRSWLKLVARRGGFAVGSSRSMRSSLVASLATDKVTPDPAQFTPDGLLGAAVLDDVRAAPGATIVDLQIFGINAQVEVAAITRMQSTRSALLQIKPQNTPVMTVRPDLSNIGVILKRHTFRLRELQIATPDASAINIPTTLMKLFAAAQKDKDAVAFLVSTDGSTRAPLSPLHADKEGNLVLRRRAGDAGIVVGKLSERPRGTARAKRVAWAVALDGVPVGVLQRKRARNEPVPVIDLATGGVRRPPIGEPPAGEPPVVRPDRPPVLTIPLPPPTRDNFAITRFKQAFAQMSQTTKLETPDPLPAFVAFDVKTARDTLVARLNPDVMVQRRVRMMISGVASATLEGIVGLTILPFFDRIMAAPEIAAPMFSYLAAYNRERFLPGIGQLAPDSITLLETNPRFIESFMVGLNYEMNRELLWREYPTDQRGTPIRTFWAWADGSPDLQQPIHQWIVGNLGTHVRGAGQGGQIVLLRGQLLRRYPNTIVYAWRAKGGLLKDPPVAGDIREPVFSGTFAPDVSFAGFDLRDSDLAQGDGWFFVLQEQPTEPRFGFDETLTVSTNELDNWSSASWPNTGIEPGGHLLVTGSPLNGKVIGGVEFGKNSAHMAHIILQKPMRVAIHGKHLA